MKGMEFGQCKHYKMDEEIIYYKSYRKKNKIRFLLLKKKQGLPFLNTCIYL